MFVPTYLEWLDRTEHHQNGWPTFVPPEAQEWAGERVSQILRDSKNPLPLHVITGMLFDRDQVGFPECFRRMGWDPMYGCTYRALCAAKADNFWSEGSGRW